MRLDLSGFTRLAAVVAATAGCGAGTESPAIDAAAAAVPVGVSDTPIPVEVDGIARSYAAYVPQAVVDRGVPGPLVLAIHGSGGNGQSFYSTTGWRALADEQELIVLYPTGLEYYGYEGSDPSNPDCVLKTAWNHGDLETVFCRDGQVAADDVGFIRALVAAWTRTGLVDDAAVHASGFSAGGAFTARLASEASDLVRGVSIVGGTLHVPADATRAAVPVLFFLGTLDEHALERAALSELPFGETVFDVPYVQEVRDGYLDLTRLDVPLTHTSTTRAHSFCFSSPQSGAVPNVFHFVLLDGMRHIYPPGQNDYPLDAAQVSWSFFAGTRTEPERESWCTTAAP